MPFTKLLPTSIDLAQNFTFTGTVAGAGKIGQVLQVSTKTHTTTNSTSYVDCTNMSLNITPTATSSKILAIANFAGLFAGGTDLDAILLRIVRGSTQIGKLNNVLYKTNDDEILTCVPLTALDSPSSSSQLTYKLQMHSRLSNNVQINADGGSDTSLTLMEVLA